MMNQDLYNYVQDARWNTKKSRQIYERIVIEGDLIVQTPLHLGSGEDNEMSSFTLLMQDDKPIITGSTLAGALRSYLLWYELGAEALNPESFSQSNFPDGLKRPATVKLFGGYQGDDDGCQSNLIIDHAIADTRKTERRTTSRRNSETRTAADKGLYSFDFWEAGTVFPLRFELILSEGDDAETLKQALATALNGLSNGDISLGMRKHRGLGRVHVPKWHIKSYRLTDRNDLIAWIGQGDKTITTPDKTHESADVLLDVQYLPDARQVLKLNATFTLDGSMLIRSEIDPIQNRTTANTVHLQSKQYVDGQAKAKFVPIVSGTSVAGAMRARAYQIVRVLHDKNKATEWMNKLFGKDMNDDKQDEQPTASRLFTHDAVIDVDEAQLRWVQNRVRIDRFTGGASDGALFSQKPIFSDNTACITLEFQLLEPEHSQIGLLLMLLKDLWTADLALGGEVSIGRGRLRGVEACIAYDNQHWKIRSTDDGIAVEGKPEVLEEFATALREVNNDNENREN